MKWLSLPLIAMLTFASAAQAAPVGEHAFAVTTNPAQRDVLATAFLYPFMTDGEIEYRSSDTEARVRSAGGLVLFRYPGIKGVTVSEAPDVVPNVRTGSETTPVVRETASDPNREVVGTVLSPDSLLVDLPAGTCQIRIVTDELSTSKPAAAPALPEGVATPDQFNARSKKLKAGDTLVVRDGIYSDWNVAVNAQGTAEKPIVIRPQTPGGVIFRRSTKITIRGRSVVLRGFRFEHCGPDVVVRVADARECRVAQCHFFQCGNPASTFHAILRVDMKTNGCRVDNCFFTGSKGINLQQRISGQEGLGVDNVFDHNLFRDIYRYWINGQENIQMGQNQTGLTGAARPRLTVEYNLFDHAWGDGEILSNKSTGNTIRFNVAAHCLRSAVTLRGGDEVTFHGNVLWNNADGLRVMGCKHRITGNVFLPHPQLGILFETGSDPTDQQVASDDTMVQGNTFIGTAGGAVGGTAASETRPHLANRVVVEGNTFVGTGAVPVDTRYLPGAIVRDNQILPSVSVTPNPAPPLPPRPLLAPGLFAAEVLWQADAERKLSDTSDSPAPPLPADFYLEWEYRPETYTSAATLRFGDSVLSWGGADTNGKPRSRIELRRAGSDAVYADAADPINHAMDYQYQAWIKTTPNTRTEPDPAQWYLHTLIRAGGKLMLLVKDSRRTGAGIPILLQDLRAPQGSEPPLLTLTQTGTGHWRKMRLHAARYQGDAAPPVPADLAATRYGTSLISLRWKAVPGFTYDIHRSVLNGSNIQTGDVATDLPTGRWDDFDIAPGRECRYQIRSVNPLGLQSEQAEAAISIPAAAGTGAFYRIIPAPAAKIAAPMTRATTGNREHITGAPGLPAAMSSPPDEGSAEIPFRVEKDGEYAVWGLVLTPDNGSDSFYATVGAEPYKIWYTGIHIAWEWSRIWTGKLPSGKHVLKIKHREPKARVSAVLVTDDAGFGISNSQPGS